MGLAIAGAVLGGLGGKRAGDTLAGGYSSAIDEYRRQYGLDRPLYDPYINAGKGAFEDIEKQRGWMNEQFGAQDIYSDPSYRFRMNQGNQATQGLLNAQGGYGGGNSLAALQKYGQGAASTEYGAAFGRHHDARNSTLNRLLNIAKQGQFGVAGATELGSELSGRVGEAMVGRAGARGAGINALYKGVGAGVAQGEALAMSFATGGMSGGRGGSSRMSGGW